MRYRRLIASLIVLHSREYHIAGQVEQSKIISSYGIGPDAFASILNRECESELKLLESTHGVNAVTDAWQKSTEYWSNAHSPQTFLVCNEYPKFSGYERRKQIQKAASECAYSPSCSGNKILEDTIFNDDNMTCVYVYTVPTIALCMWTMGSRSTITGTNHSMTEIILDNQTFHIPSRSLFRVQPLLPMMKIAAGTVFTVESILWNASEVRIAMEINFSKDTELELIEAKDPFSRYDLLEAFPYTGRLIECNENGETWDRLSQNNFIEANDSSMDGTIDGLRGIRSRTIRLLKNDSNNRTNITVDILSYLAHIASNPCIRYIEVLNDE